MILVRFADLANLASCLMILTFWLLTPAFHYISIQESLSSISLFISFVLPFAGISKGAFHCLQVSIVRSF